MENSNYMNNLSNDEQDGQNNNMSKNPYNINEESNADLNNSAVSLSTTDNNISPSNSNGIYLNNTDSSQELLTPSNSSSSYSSLDQSSELSQASSYDSQNITSSTDRGSSSTFSSNSSTSLSMSESAPSFSENNSGNNHLSVSINPSSSTHTEVNSSLDVSQNAAIPLKKDNAFLLEHSLKSEKKEILKDFSVSGTDKINVDSVHLALGLICLAFFLLFQNFAQVCKKYCQTDSSISNSIISGSSLAYLLSKGFPFMINLVNTATPRIENLYLRHEGHLLLVSLIALGLGFLFNYSFEKKTARNIIEDVSHSSALYRMNIMILAVVFFFSGLLLINVVHMNYIDVAEYGLFVGLMLCMETSTLCHIFNGRNELYRRIVLSVGVISGFTIGKQIELSIMPLLFSIGFSFILGFFIFTTMRVELATVKRNSSYPAFIISFVGVMALTLIQSLYESVRC